MTSGSRCALVVVMRSCNCVVFTWYSINACAAVVESWKDEISHTCASGEMIKHLVLLWSFKQSQDTDKHGFTTNVPLHSTRSYTIARGERLRKSKELAKKSLVTETIPPSPAQLRLATRNYGLYLLILLKYLINPCNAPYRGNSQRFSIRKARGFLWLSQKNQDNCPKLFSSTQLKFIKWEKKMLRIIKHFWERHTPTYP